MTYTRGATLSWKVYPPPHLLSFSLSLSLSLLEVSPFLFCPLSINYVFPWNIDLYCVYKRCSLREEEMKESHTHIAQKKGVILHAYNVVYPTQGLPCYAHVGSNYGCMLIWIFRTAVVQHQLTRGPPVSATPCITNKCVQISLPSPTYTD